MATRRKGKQGITVRVIVGKGSGQPRKRKASTSNALVNAINKLAGRRAGRRSSRSGPAGDPRHGWVDANGRFHRF